ncbi:hypothetical protein [Dysosmobacter welbionis]|uniref:hypothetical protein n=1 Tax=Dysosmobacter welbionis TaxID=2093857 RepID=UPI0039932604
MNRISSNYEENVQWFNDVLGAGRSCDMVCRDLYVGGRRARFWVIDGFGGDAILERMGAFWLSLQPEAVQGLTEMQQFADRYVTFMEVNVSYDRDDIVTSVLMAKACGDGGAVRRGADRRQGVSQPQRGRAAGRQGPPGLS